MHDQFNLCEVYHLGRVAYEDAWALQNRLAEERGRGAVPDRLLLLEHPHTYTLGSSGQYEHLLLSAEELMQRGITVLRVDRGGDITYHGPGQLVGYPILQLERSEQGGGLRGGVTDYLRKLEQVIVATLADFDIAGETIPGLTGVWVDDLKLAAIGVKITVRAVTKHGFALNVNTDLNYFEGIVPCGIHDKGVTSMAQVLGERVGEVGVAERLVEHFGDVFEMEMVVGKEVKSEKLKV